MKYNFYSNKSPKKGYSWETAPSPIPEEQITETLETDVVFMGGGISGLASAARCSSKGLSCIVIDKNKKLLAHSGQISAINTRWMAEQGIHIDKKQLAADWLKISGSRVQEELLWIFLNRSGEGFEWLLDLTEGTVDARIYVPYKGLMFNEYFATHQISKKQGTDKYKYPAGGFLTCEILEKELEKNGGKLFRDTAAVYLEKDDNGRVVSCIAKQGDGKYQRYIGKKAVVLATGDCCDNREMVEAFCPTGTRPAMHVPRPGNTGDGQMMAFWAGAALDNPEWASAIHIVVNGGVQFFFLHVNQLGKRFMNEDTWLQAKAIRCLMQPGGDFAYTIFDSKWLDEIAERWDILGGQGIVPHSMLGDPFNRAGIEKHIRGLIEGHLVMYEGSTYEHVIEDIGCYEANTIEELAAKIDIPADSLVKTVARYNEVVANGDDVDFGKRKELLTTVTKPPYYALRWGPSLLDIFGGALTNTELNVLSSEAEPIPGLYAVGNAAGGMYAIDYPLLLNGNSYGRALAYAMQLADVLSNK